MEGAIRIHVIRAAAGDEHQFRRDCKSRAAPGQAPAGARPSSPEDGGVKGAGRAAVYRVALRAGSGAPAPSRPRRWRTIFGPCSREFSMKMRSMLRPAWMVPAT